VAANGRAIVTGSMVELIELDFTCVAAQGFADV
jgi:hypothetical protein